MCAMSGAIFKGRLVVVTLPSFALPRSRSYGARGRSGPGVGFAATLILFSTDNGPEDVAVYSNAKGSAGPFRGRKRSLYEGGTRVPSFAVFGGGTPKPTIPSHAVEHTPISASDWLPTVLAIAGVAPPAGLLANIDGEDMSRVLLRQATGQRPPVPRTKMLFWEWRFAVAGTCDNAAPNIAVRDGVWKYMQVRPAQDDLVEPEREEKRKKDKTILTCTRRSSLLFSFSFHVSRLILAVVPPPLCPRATSRGTPGHAPPPSSPKACI